MMNTRSGLDLIELAALQRSTEPYQVSFFYMSTLKNCPYFQMPNVVFPRISFLRDLSVSIINSTLTVDFTVPDKSCRIY